MVEEHIFTESVIETPSDLGEQMSFDRMVELEGGMHNTANVQAALNRARGCLKRGRRYYVKDTWSKRINFYFVRDTFADTKQRQWDSVTRGKTAAIQQDAAGDARGASSSDHQQPLPKPPQEPKPVEPKPPRAKTKLEKALSVANTRKVQLNDIESKGNDLVSCFEQMRHTQRRSVVMVRNWRLNSQRLRM